MKNKRKRLLQALSLALFAIFITACQATPDQEATNPVVIDPDLDINVTPDPENIKYAYFTLKVTRLGVHRGIGWTANGEVYLKSTMDLGGDDPADTQFVNGTGFGKAGYDASGGPCINMGGWPIEFQAVGDFSARDCTLTLKVEETWPKTEAHAICLGFGSEVEGPPYMLVFPNLKFTEAKVRVDTVETIDEITWTNSFTLIPGEGLEDVDCNFAAPPEN